MDEIRIRPQAIEAREGERPQLTPESLAAIDVAARTAESIGAAYLREEVRARLEHVSLHVPPNGPAQEVVLRIKPSLPFFEVTTERV
jgi:hypothetical protein